MAYEDYEVSVESSQPYELMEISVGSETFRYSNQIDDIMHAGNLYYGLQFDHAPITTGDETIGFNLPADNQFVVRYATSAPGRLASVTLLSVQRADPTDAKVIYKGVVRTVSFTDDMTEAKISAIPITAAFDKEIPDRTYQNACNHVLFSPECGVNENSYRYQEVVTAVNANTITVNGLLVAKGAGWAVGGFVAYGTDDFRQILSQSGDVLTLNLGFYEEVLGQTVDVYAGCDHSLGTCTTKFSNSINFGGCPYVPTKNPFVTGID